MPVAVDLLSLNNQVPWFNLKIFNVLLTNFFAVLGLRMSNSKKIKKELKTIAVILASTQKKNATK